MHDPSKIIPFARPHSSASVSPGFPRFAAELARSAPALLPLAIKPIALGSEKIDDSDDH